MIEINLERKEGDFGFDATDANGHTMIHQNPIYKLSRDLPIYDSPSPSDHRSEDDMRY